MSRRRSARYRLLVQRLSGDPGGERGERIRYHGARAFLLVALAALVTLSFPPTERTDAMTTYSVEDVAQEDVVAQIPFTVQKSAAELELERRRAAEAIPPTFAYRPQASDTVAARLSRFFERLDSAATAGDTLGVVTILQESRIDADPAQTEYVVDDAARSALRQAADEAVRDMLPRGIADPTPLSDVTTNVITVRRDGQETNVPVDDVSTSQDFYERAVSALPPELPPDAHQLLRLILIAHLEHSLVFDVEATEEDRTAARATVNTAKADVLEGEAIVRAAERIGPETLERLQAYQQALRDAGLFEPEEPMLGAVIGAGLVNLMLLSIFGLLLMFSRPNIYANFRWLLLITLLAATYFGAGVAIDRAGLPAEWLPIAFVALPVAVLWDTRIALLMALMLAAVTGTLEPFSAYGTVLVVMVAGATAAMSVRAVRRRSETWVSIAIISGSASLVYVAYGMSTGQPVVEFARASLVITGNATVSALLAVGFLWVFELFTGITTDQTLLEWADPTRPLLRRLSMEAPGTYAHTINVANLAEAAATEIGANGLLCRVGVLYHDVGKMLKPYYFVENQPDGRNPHDKLKPETSAAIVREHVTEGVRLAKEANVPDIVTDFILQHHGTQRIGFFYQKAREESEEEPELSRFSYPGPKPQSKETAIVMLADSCESAARAMHDPTPERIVDLIDTVVDGKVADHQLDESPLTLRELARIKHQFVTILSGVKHRRIEYPETKHLTDAEDAGDASSSPKLEAGDEVA